MDLVNIFWMVAFSPHNTVGIASAEKVLVISVFILFYLQNFCSTLFLRCFIFFAKWFMLRNTFWIFSKVGICFYQINPTEKHNYWYYYTFMVVFPLTILHFHKRYVMMWKHKFILVSAFYSFPQKVNEYKDQLNSGRLRWHSCNSFNSVACWAS